ncbi:putative oxidoreductase [Xylogone sp. PMI_703]|nr:putative oxidoreductase [Xylogone sp. PMI_703]
MSPIRVGLIGLGRETGGSAVGVWAIKTHLPYLLASPKYEIVALGNSTVESAKASIAYHKLGQHVKAYGSPEDLANDPNVDLVVVSVAVGKHYALSKPALLAGKDVFVEWPLGASVAEAEELTEIAASKGVKTIVGLQARPSPLVLKLKELINGGKIGKVTSTAVVSYFNLPPDTWTAGAEYFLDMESGGNSLTILFGHFFDSFTNILGDFSQLSSILHTEYRSVKILNAKGEMTNPNYTRTAPDHILVQGRLKSGAVASLNFRMVVGKPANDTVTRWIITGTSGEIEVCTKQMGWQMDPPGTTLTLRSGDNNEAKLVDFAPADETAAVAASIFPAPNTARLYEAFALNESDKFATFADALETHRSLERIRSKSKEF